MMALRKEEIYRKVLHIFSGSIVPALILYIPMYAPPFSCFPVWLKPELYPPVLAAVFTFIFLSIELLRFRVPFVQRLFYGISGATLRPEEDKKMTGATYIVAAAFICSVVFVKQPYISFMVLCAFIWGDAVAALVGQSFGRTKIGKKSLEGSTGCFVLCMILFLGAFPLVPHLLDSWNGKMSILMAVLASLCITVMELFPITFAKKYVVNDNLTVPVITGIIMYIAYPVLK
jgi:dolichol kinase